MTRRKCPCVQDGLTYVTSQEERTALRMPYPGLVILILILVYVFQGCNSSESLLNDLKENSTLDVLVAMTADPLVLWEDKDDRDSSDGEANVKITNEQYGMPNDTDRTNDVMSKLGLVDSGSGDEPDQNESNANIKTLTKSQFVTTESPKPYTRRDIYIRGHLLKHPPPGPPRTFLPPEATDGLFRAPNSIHLNRVQNFRDEPDGTSNRKKRKHSANKERFYNYKLLYGTMKGSDDTQRKKTEFYAWIFGAAMLGLGSLTTVTSCFVFCFCGDKVRQRRAARARRVNDKAGQYQRVESVSSIVDHVGEHSEYYEEDQIDNVTII